MVEDQAADLKRAEDVALAAKDAVAREYKERKHLAKSLEKAKEKLGRAERHRDEAKKEKDNLKAELEKLKKEHAEQLQAKDEELAKSKEDSRARIIEEYQDSQEYQDEVAVEKAVGIRQGYLDCLTRAESLFPEQDFSSISYSKVYPESDSEEAEEEEAELGGIFGEADAEEEEDRDEDPDQTQQSASVRSGGVASSSGPD